MGVVVIAPFLEAILARSTVGRTSVAAFDRGLFRDVRLASATGGLNGTASKAGAAF